MARHTGSLTTGDKYRCFPIGYNPDIQAYLAGDRRHIYASQLRDKDGLTWVLAGDNDEADIPLLPLMTDLARAGIASVAWQRRPGRWHLETYWSERVIPQAGHNRLLRAAPLWAQIAEVFPVDTGKSNRTNHRLGWPLYHRIENEVIPCSAVFMFPDRPGEAIEPPGIVADRQGLAVLIARCVTPASLILACDYPKVEQDPVQGMGGLLLVKSSPTRKRGYSGWQVDLIEEFNRCHSWHDVASWCGGFDHRGFFRAIWRPGNGGGMGERTPSVKPDGTDSRWCCDYGDGCRKYDKYGIWCRVKGIDPHDDLRERRRQLQAVHS
jgi:hypothetical protein